MRKPEWMREVVPYGRPAVFPRREGKWAPGVSYIAPEGWYDEKLPIYGSLLYLFPDLRMQQTPELSTVVLTARSAFDDEEEHIEGGAFHPGDAMGEPANLAPPQSQGNTAGWLIAPY